MTLLTQNSHRHSASTDCRWGVALFRGLHCYQLPIVFLFLFICTLTYFYVTRSQRYSPPCFDVISLFQDGIELNISVDSNDACVENGNGEDDTVSRSAVENDIENALKDTRQDIDNELIGYSFPPGKSLENLAPENGGSPIRIIIITTWRSGSTFLGDVLLSNPATMYHFEPLTEFGTIQIRGPPLAQVATDRLKKLLTCDYTDLEKDYLAFAQKQNSWPLQHAVLVWKRCQRNTSLCWSPQFWSSQCQLFPFQLMKTTRLRLSIIEDLLDDKDLNVRVILLVRDPRGTMHSRQHVTWCLGHPDCMRPLQLCSDLVADYATALRFNQKYPKRFKAIRYEDLSLEPQKTTEELLTFLGLSLSPKTVGFIQNHTTMTSGDWHSTFRDSKSTPFHWRTGLRHSRVRDIQRVCTSALNLWGYVLAENATHQRDFNPVLPSFQMH